MRPINLIPPEQRRGEHAPLRSGALAYIVLAGLVLVLGGVTALVLTNNEIGERESDVARLEAEDAAAAAKAERLSAYTQFRNLSEQRVATVASLADSRFDWERVMRELSLILPKDVWLVSLEASAGGGESGEGGAAGIAGPSLSLSGCANGQEGVAGFVTALKDIDGVTRVGVESSELPEQQSDSGGGGGGSDGGGECQTRDFIAKFQIVVAFDAAPVPASTSEGGAAPVATTEPEGESGEESGDEDEEGSEEASEEG